MGQPASTGAGRAPSTSMNAEEHAQLERAAELVRPLARAASLARSNGAGLLVFGVVGVLFSLSGRYPADLALGVLLAVSGFVELRTARRLARADPSAPRILAANELLLMAGILAYCTLRLADPPASGEDPAGQLGALGIAGDDLAALTESLSRLIYLSCAGITLLYQGGLALYFLRRRARIESYLTECPEWARRVVGAFQR